jgi:hypothetical protein
MEMRNWSWLIATALLLTIAVVPAAAGGKSAPSGTLLLGSGLAASSSSFREGDRVTMTASYSGLRKQDTVRVQVLCMQDAGVVYGDAITLAGSPQQVSFTLGENSTTATSVWTSGAASCRADLYYIANAGGGTVNYLANVGFQATAS